MQKYQAVIFDLYGTLIDNYSVEEYRQLCREVSAVLELDSEEFYRVWEPTYPRRAQGIEGDSAFYLREVAAVLGRTPTPAAIDAAVEIRLDWARRILSTRPHTPAVLQQIADMEYPLGLVSDCSWELPRVWDQSALAPFFAAPVFSCEEKTKKPDWRMYLTACQRLAVDPRACIYIGDGGSNELSGASALGMRAVQIEMPHELSEMTGGYQRQQWDGTRISHISAVLELI